MCVHFEINLSLWLSLTFSTNMYTDIADPSFGLLSLFMWQVDLNAISSGPASSAVTIRSVGGVTTDLALVLVTACLGVTQDPTTLIPALMTNGSSPAVQVSHCIKY